MAEQAHEFDDILSSESLLLTPIICVLEFCQSTVAPSEHSIIWGKSSPKKSSFGNFLS